MKVAGALTSGTKGEKVTRQQSLSCLSKNGKIYKAGTSIPVKKMRRRKI